MKYSAGAGGAGIAAEEEDHRALVLVAHAHRHQHEDDDEHRDGDRQRVHQHVSPLRRRAGADRAPSPWPARPVHGCKSASWKCRRGQAGPARRARSAPFCSKWLAKAWRSTCGLTLAAGRPAAAATVLRSRANAWRVRWPLSLSEGNSQGLVAEAGRDFLQQRAIALDRRARGFRQRRQPVLVALAAHGDQRLLGARHRARQRDQFRYAQARGVEQLDQARHARGGEALARRPLGIVDPLARDARSAFRHRRGPAPWATAGAGVGPSSAIVGIVAAQALDEQMLVELADRRQPPRHRRRAEAPCARLRPEARACRRRSASSGVLPRLVRNAT